MRIEKRCPSACAERERASVCVHVVGGGVGYPARSGLASLKTRATSSGWMKPVPLLNELGSNKLCRLVPERQALTSSRTDTAARSVGKCTKPSSPIATDSMRCCRRLGSAATTACPHRSQLINDDWQHSRALTTAHAGEPSACGQVRTLGASSAMRESPSRNCTRRSRLASSCQALGHPSTLQVVPAMA